MRKPKLYANRDHTTNTYSFNTNPYTEELLKRSKSILEAVTGINVSTTVLVRRAIYSLLMELTKKTERLGKSKDLASALGDIRDQEAFLLVRLAGRNVTTREYNAHG